MQVEHQEHRGRPRHLEDQLVPDADPHGATVSPGGASRSIGLAGRRAGDTAVDEPLVPYRTCPGSRASHATGGWRRMTYCLGIWTRHGLVMASDSRTNAGHDQVNVARKMHIFVPAGRARLHPPQRAAASPAPSRSSPCCGATSIRPRPGPGAVALRRRARHRASRCAASPTWTGRPSSATTSSSTSTSSWVARSAASRRAVHHLPPGQPAPGQRGLALPPDRRDQVRPAHPRSGHPLREDDARGGGEVRAPLAGLHDALERHRGPPHRSPRLRRGRVRDHPPAAVRRRRSRSREDRNALGAGAAPGRRPASRRSASGCAPARPARSRAPGGDDPARRAFRPARGGDRRASAGRSAAPS